VQSNGANRWAEPRSSKRQIRNTRYEIRRQLKKQSQFWSFLARKRGSGKKQSQSASLWRDVTSTRCQIANAKQSENTKPGPGDWSDPAHDTSRTGGFRAPGSSSEVRGSSRGCIVAPHLRPATGAHPPVENGKDFTQFSCNRLLSDVDYPQSCWNAVDSGLGIGLSEGR